MKRLLMNWLACFAGIIATATGLSGAVGYAPPWKAASAIELETAWSRVSPDALNKFGGVSTRGTKTEQSNTTVCKTDQCRSVGGHGYICTDVGMQLASINSGFAYAKTSTVICGNEVQYTFTNCSGSAGGNTGNCAAGTLTWTDYFDP